MEIFIAILIALAIFIGIPAIIGIIILGIYSGLFRVFGRRLQRRGEFKAVTQRLKLLEHRSVQLIILVIMCLYYPIVYYFGELIDHFKWEAIRWDFFFTVHDIHRVVFFVPILFGAYFFRLKGAIITTIFAFAVFLPRSIILSPYPDPINRMVVFTIFVLCIGILVGAMRNQIERLQRSFDIVKSKQENGNV